MIVFLQSKSMTDEPSIPEAAEYEHLGMNLFTSVEKDIKPYVS